MQGPEVPQVLPPQTVRSGGHAGVTGTASLVRGGSLTVLAFTLPQKLALIVGVGSSWILDSRYRARESYISFVAASAPSCLLLGISKFLERRVCSTGGAGDVRRDLGLVDAPIAWTQAR